MEYRLVVTNDKKIGLMSTEELDNISKEREGNFKKKVIEWAKPVFEDVFTKANRPELLKQIDQPDSELIKLLFNFKYLFLIFKKYEIEEPYYEEYKYIDLHKELENIRQKWIDKESFTYKEYCPLCLEQYGLDNNPFKTLHPPMLPCFLFNEDLTPMQKYKFAFLPTYEESHKDVFLIKYVDLLYIPFAQFIKFEDPRSIKEFIDIDYTKEVKRIVKICNEIKPDEPLTKELSNLVAYNFIKYTFIMFMAKADLPPLSFLEISQKGTIVKQWYTVISKFISYFWENIGEWNFEKDGKKHFETGALSLLRWTDAYLP